MQRIPIGRAAPGMILAQTVVNDKGQPLATQGSELTVSLIERLDRHGASQITVEGHPVIVPGEPLPDPDKVRLDVERAFIKHRKNDVMLRFKEMILRHRVAHAEASLAEIQAELARRGGSGGAD